MESTTTPFSSKCIANSSKYQPGNIISYQEQLGNSLSVYWQIHTVNFVAMMEHWPLPCIPNCSITTKETHHRLQRCAQIHHSRPNVLKWEEFENFVSSTITVAWVKSGQMWQGTDNAQRGRVVNSLIFERNIRNTKRYTTERKDYGILDTNDINKKSGKPAVNGL